MRNIYHFFPELGTLKNTSQTMIKHIFHVGTFLTERDDLSPHVWMDEVKINIKSSK